MNKEKNLNEIMVVDMTEKHFDLLKVEDAQKKLDMNFVNLEKQRNPRLPLDQFISHFQQCQLAGADPRIKEAYLVSYEKSVCINGQWTKQMQGSTIFNYLFLIKKAEETGQLNGFESGIKHNSNNELKNANGYAKVFRKGWDNPVIVNCKFTEFAKFKKDGKLMGMWASMPEYMLEKCALANAIRRAFPSLSNIYISEEMEQGETITNVENKKPVETEVLPKQSAFGKAKESIEQAKTKEETDRLIAKIDKQKKSFSNKEFTELVKLIGNRINEIEKNKVIETTAQPLEDQVPIPKDEDMNL